jgi:hypothetical protein
VTGAEHGAFSGVHDRFHATVNPNDKFSVSAAHHLASNLNDTLDRRKPERPVTPPPPAPPPGTPPPTGLPDSGPPALEGPLPEDWNAWSDDVLNTIDQRIGET